MDRQTETGISMTFNRRKREMDRQTETEISMTFNWRERDISMAFHINQSLARMTSP